MRTVLLIAAVILFVFAAFSFSPWPAVHLGWLGLGFLAGSFVVPN